MPRTRKARPKHKKWRVIFVLARESVVVASTAEDAEKRAHAAANIDGMLLVGCKLRSVNVGWINKADPGFSHLEGCAGNHCWHSGCDDEDPSYVAYCTQCDPDCY